MHFEKILEFGSYDAFFLTSIFEFIKTKKCKQYNLTDIYTRRDSLHLAKHNFQILRKKTSGIKFDIISSYGETILKKIKKSYDLIFIFETLEHVNDEKKLLEI